MSYSAIILGATGLVGSELLKLLLADSHYINVKALVRSTILDIAIVSNPKFKQEIVDFNQQQGLESLMKCDHIFCCLGTTIKKAASKQEFEKIDLQLPTMLAKQALESGASTVVFISSIGASTKASSFYLRIKGRLEQEMRSLGFQKTLAVRPSLLTGHRQDKRLGEELAIVLLSPASKLMQGSLKKYRPISAHEVAQVMLQLALNQHPDTDCQWQAWEN